MIEIKSLDRLLAPVLGDGKQISSYETRSLIAPGENYGSVMLALDVKVNDKAIGSEEELNLVAKLCPPSELIKKMFNIPVTFKKEAGFYKCVIPTLQEFQKERGAKVTYNFFPKYFGSRLNLESEDIGVDDDACLLLENLKIKGFDTVDRLQGFDLKTARYIIKDLATFHAVPLAYKLCNPEGFKKNIMPYIVTHIEPEMLNDDFLTGTQKTIVDSMLKNKECVQYVDRVISLITRCVESYKNAHLLLGDEAFMTVIHNDFWVNNTMVVFDKQGNPISNAMVDFQLQIYGNPANDLLFFIYTSLSTAIITDHYQELVDLYHTTFIQVLKDLKVNTEPFNKDAFQSQIEKAAMQSICFQILFMLKPIFTDKTKVKQLSDMNENDITNADSLSELYFPKLWSVILDFVEKKWL